MIQHTPGPWWIDNPVEAEKGDDFWPIYSGAFGTRAAVNVADVYTAADARLIAAAPEMLGEVVDTVREWQGLCSCSDTGIVCKGCRNRALLARIEGGKT